MPEQDGSTPNQEPLAPEAKEEHALNQPGDSQSPAPQRGGPWDRTRFEEVIAAELEPEDAEVVERLFAWAQQKGLRQQWGKGKKWGSCFFQVDANGSTHHTFALWTTGLIELQFEHYKKHGHYASVTARKELLEVLRAAVPDFDAESPEGRPSIPFKFLREAMVQNAFLAVWDDYLETINPRQQQDPFERVGPGGLPSMSESALIELAEALGLEVSGTKEEMIEQILPIPPRPKLEQMKKKELARIARLRGLPKNGYKEELIDRLANTGEEDFNDPGTGLILGLVIFAVGYWFLEPESWKRWTILTSWSVIIATLPLGYWRLVLITILPIYPYYKLGERYFNEASAVTLLPGSMVLSFITAFLLFMLSAFLSGLWEDEA